MQDKLLSLTPTEARKLGADTARVAAVFSVKMLATALEHHADPLVRHAIAAIWEVVGEPAEREAQKLVAEANAQEVLHVKLSVSPQGRPRVQGIDDSARVRFLFSSRGDTWEVFAARPGSTESIVLIHGEEEESGTVEYARDGRKVVGGDTVKVGLTSYKIAIAEDVAPE